MDARKLIEDAEKFIRTDQPNMAMLYMKNARQEIAKERITRMAEAKGMTLEEYMGSISEAFSKMADHVAKQFAPIAKAFSDLGKRFTQMTDPEDPDSYTLAN